MANRVQLGNLGSGVFGLKVSKPSVNVLTASDKDLLFDSTKARTGQIYAGANGLNFFESTTDLDPDVSGTNAIVESIAGTNHTGKKIIIDGTTVTMSSTTTMFNGTVITTAYDIKDDITAANISNITAIRRSDAKIRITKPASAGDLVISYVSTTNSMEGVLGINAGTYAVGILSTSGVNYLTGTGSTKAGLGYLPLITLSELNTGTAQYDGSEEEYDAVEEVSTFSLWETTETHMYPISGVSNPPEESSSNANQSSFDAGGPIGRGRSYNILEDFDENKVNCENCSFFILRIPLGYGYMNSTYYG